MNQKKRDRKKPRSNIQFLIEFARPFRIRIGFGMILALLTSLCFLSMGGAIREMLAHFNTSPLVPDALYHSIFKVFLFFCGGNLCLFSRIYTFGRLGERMVWVMRDRIFQRLLSQDMPFFESHKVGDLTARIISDAQALRTLTIGVVSDAFKCSIFIIGGVVMMIHVNKLAAGITFLALLIYAIPTFIMHQRMRKVARQGCAVIGDITSSCEEYLNAIRTVKVLGYEPYVFGNFQKNTEREYQFFAWYIVLFGVVQSLLPLAACLSGAFLVFMLWSPSFLSLLSPETVVSFFYYCGFVIFGLKGMQSVWAAFLRQGGAIERLNSLFDDTHGPEARTQGLSIPSSGGSPSIEFDHVWFHYPSAPDRWVLEDVSFCIAPGEKVAIVGPSGTGKTTLFLLLVGLYRPVRGRILIGGIDLQELDRDQIRKSIGIVQQDPLIFSGTLKDNITMGDPTLTQSKVQDVLNKVHLSDFVHTLSHGLDTFLGEKGVRLSGGQKQRLSLARVLLKDPSILMCDEATSALDLETEELIYSHLSLHTRAKTCLTISHRLSTIIPHETTYILTKGQMTKKDHRQRLAGSV